MKKFRFSVFVFLACIFYAAAGFSQSLWELANKNRDVLRISTFFQAHRVRDYLSTDEGIDEAIEWCKSIGITRVFIETFRGGYTAERGTLAHAKTRFERAGIEASGGVTTTGIGKLSSIGTNRSCFNSEETLKELQGILEFTASIFDVIMLDDYLFTDCECEDCQMMRGGRRMSEYRCDLMNEVSREYIIKPSKAVNPKVKLIIKYPQWYDDFHRRGYEVLGESASYDIIWVGTEVRDRDYDQERWSRKMPYEAYFIMRWLGDIGGAKTVGGWFDPYDTSPDTYVEQARMTVVGDAKEMMLFCYGSLIRNNGPENVEKLLPEIPELFELAKLVRNKPLRGILASKPPNSDPYDNFDATETFFSFDADGYVYDFVGMMGLPLIPSAGIDTSADAAFFPFQALKDPAFPEKLTKMLREDKPVLITDTLAESLGNLEQYENLTVLNVNGEPHSLLKLSREELTSIRNRMLAPIGIRFDAPNKVGLYLIGWDVMVIENFNDEPVDVTVDTRFTTEARVKVVLPVDGDVDYEFTRRKLIFHNISPRTLVAINY